MMIAWVIGNHGLLGSALCRKLAHNNIRVFQPLERFCWSNERFLELQLAAAIQSFSSFVDNAKEWQIYWAAGMGSMGSSAISLVSETRALSLLLRLIESDSRLNVTSGTVVFASSAGAIYAGSFDYHINENSVPAPTTSYAREKIIQEELIRLFTHANKNMSALLARLSTLYGPKQSVVKQQGLLSHIARCMLKNQPIQIYVPFDSMRDYILADDAATTIISTLRAIKEPEVYIKIIASEQPTSIAEIISNFKRIFRRTPLIVTSTSKLSNIYPRRMKFKSIILPECPQTPKTSLLVGIAQIIATELALFKNPRA